MRNCVLTNNKMVVQDIILLYGGRAPQVLRMRSQRGFRVYGGIPYSTREGAANMQSEARLLTFSH